MLKDRRLVLCFVGVAHCYCDGWGQGWGCRRDDLACFACSVRSSASGAWRRRGPVAELALALRPLCLISDTVCGLAVPAVPAAPDQTLPRPPFLSPRGPTGVTDIAPGA